MFRRILSFPVFCLCFLTGLIAAPLAFESRHEESGFNVTPATSASANTTSVNLRVRRADRIIQIDFDGITEIDGNLNANFVITNHSDVSFQYASGGPPVKGEQAALQFQVEIEGKQQYMMWCGTGLKEFSLSPGESIRTSVPMSHIANFWKKGQKIRIGYYLYQRDGKSRSEPYWSDVVPMTPELERYLERESINRI